MEKTTNEFCPEGWEPDDYNFYMIEGNTQIYNCTSIIGSIIESNHFFQLNILTIVTGAPTVPPTTVTTMAPTTTTEGLNTTTIGNNIKILS